MELHDQTNYVVHCFNNRNLLTMPLPSHGANASAKCQMTE